MKKSLTLFIALTFSMCANLLNSQVNERYFTPDGVMDQIYDRFGNKYSLNDIFIPNGNIVEIPPIDRANCSGPSNYFELYFEAGCGMDLNTQAHIDRRKVMCLVFDHLSKFISSPLSQTNQKVKIWIRDMKSLPNGALGGATSFYNFPITTLANTTGGIINSEIYKTIASGENSYKNTTFPLVSTDPNAASSGDFFHGMVVFNFNDFIWNTDLTLANAPAGKYDLYSVTLHEVMHALGIASLIGADGKSVFLPDGNYYSTYDTKLKNKDNLSLISIPTSCSKYDNVFNVNTSSINAGNCTSSGSDNTSCPNAVKYVGSVNLPVYTPHCFESGSSFSHFEGQCYPSGVPYGNNNYFCMTDRSDTGPNYTRRYPKPEERSVLCDLGYKISTTYGESFSNNFYNYGGTSCNSNYFVGINDGIDAFGDYTYTGPNQINFKGILQNDLLNGAYDPGATFECLEIVDKIWTFMNVSPSNGNNNTNILVEVEFVEGPLLLRYIPVSSSGQRGNVTYIYVYGTSGCEPSSCNLINNGGFESNNGGGVIDYQYNVPERTRVNCWKGVGTPDLYSKNEPASSSFSFNHINSSFITPLNTWNPTMNNNSIVYSWNSSEYMQTTLNSNLIIGEKYKLSFWARTILLKNQAKVPIKVWARLDKNGNYDNELSLILNNEQWQLNEFIFTATKTTNRLTIGMTNAPGESTLNALLLDDVSLELVDNSIQLNLPENICMSANISDLKSYLNVPVSGTFYLNGSAITDFNSVSAGVGKHLIIFEYTTSNGCVKKIIKYIEVLAQTTMNLTPSTLTPCKYEEVTINVSGATSYTLNPGNLTSTGNPFIFTPVSGTTYTIVGKSSSICNNTKTLVFNVLDCSCIPIGKFQEIGTNGNISGTFSNSTLYINNNATIQTTASFINCEVIIAPFVRISVSSIGHLSLIGSYFHGCNEKMWKGIYVNSGGSFTTQNYGLAIPSTSKSCLIEDAITAIDFNATPTRYGLLNLDNTTFNKNNTAIKVSNLNPSILVSYDAVLKITGCVFTSRAFPTFTGLNWQQTAPLKTSVLPNPNNPLTRQFINETVYSSTSPNSNLKYPYAGKKPEFGVIFNNVGYTVNPNSESPTYRMVNIGNNLSYNVFDNLSTSFQCTNSNVSFVGNNAFQNTVDNSVLKNSSSGKGIEANSTGSNKNKITISPQKLHERNQFINCHNAIELNNYYHQEIYKTDFWSTQAMPSNNPSVTVNHQGKLGITVSSNKYKTILIINNIFYNLENPITVKSLQNKLKSPNNIFELFILGPISIIGNEIAAQFPNYAITTQYVRQGIAVRSNIPSNSQFVKKMDKPIMITNNNLKDVPRGIECSTWKNKLLIINDNSIVMALQLTPTSQPIIIPYHYGISYTGNVNGLTSKNEIRNNNILGFDQTHPASAGINYASSTRTNLFCNTFRGVSKDISFKGVSPTSVAKSNQFANFQYAFVLENTGTYIGTQGSATLPADNTYTLNVPGSFATATLNGASAQGNTMWVHNSGLFNPNGYGTSTLPSHPILDIYSNSNGTIQYSTSSIFQTCPDVKLNVQNDPALLQEEKDYFVKLINGDFSPDNFPEEVKRNVDQLIYSLVKTDTTLKGSHQVLDDFVQEHAGSNIDKLFKIDQELLKGNIDTATLLNNQLLDHPVDNVYKSYNDLYMNYMQETFSSEDSITLYTIAEKCPFIDGIVVYDARSLYHNIYGNDAIFEERCPKINGNEGDKNLTYNNTNTSPQEASTEIKIFPNPNTGKFYILGGEDLEVELINLQGVKVSHHLNKLRENMYELDCNCQNGLYNLILSDKNEKSVHKIEIIH